MSLVRVPGSWARSRLIVGASSPPTGQLFFRRASDSYACHCRVYPTTGQAGYWALPAIDLPETYIHLVGKSTWVVSSLRMVALASPSRRVPAGVVGKVDDVATRGEGEGSLPACRALLAGHRVAGKNRPHDCAAGPGRADLASEGEDRAADVGRLGVTKPPARFDATDHPAPSGRVQRSRDGSRRRHFPEGLGGSRLRRLESRGHAGADYASPTLLGGGHRRRAPDAADGLRHVHETAPVGGRPVAQVRSGTRGLRVAGSRGNRSSRSPNPELNGAPPGHIVRQARDHRRGASG